MKLWLDRGKTNVAAPIEARRAMGRAGYEDLMGLGPPVRQSAVRERVRVLLRALGTPGDDPGSLDEMATALFRTLRPGDAKLMWLALAVITAQLPDTSTVLRANRAACLDGAGWALLAELDEVDNSESGTWVPVEVVTGAVIVDIGHTARTALSTGIQRVARETIRRWQRDHDVLLVGWTDDYNSIRRLPLDEADRAINRPGLGIDLPVEPAGGVLVPWKCTVVLPELAAERGRAERLQTLASFSGSATGLIGFDCVPIMAAETSAEGMSSAFASYLAAAAHFDRLAAISESAAVEYRGWRTMLAGAGLAGPDITPISLPTETHHPSADVIAKARARLGQGSLRMVLTVGSHEPRKNHLAVLEAAEVLWREGLTFALVLVGGNSWNSERFDERVRSLRAAKWPVRTIRALPDEMLWAAYRLAYCTVFPSLHEGFGLPVAESLASGTPVITSDFGSMREIADYGGAMLVDPRNDQELTSALRRLLVDGRHRDVLAQAALARPERTWDDYATQTWAYLIEGEDRRRSP